jgi:hypothetical protein
MAAKKKSASAASTSSDPAVFAPPVPVERLAKSVSDSTLDQTPDRVLKLLRGLTRTGIAQRMAAVGYSNADHVEGWTLLQQSSGYRPDVPIVTLQGGPADPEVAAAIKFVDDFDESGFDLADAALQRRFPDQWSYVMKGLVAKSGIAALVDVETFLDRIDALESGKGRDASTRDADQRAVKLLATRTIDRAKRAALREALRVAKSFKVQETPEPNSIDDAARERATLALRAWYEEWSKTARSVIKRRDFLISLGLANRHSRTEEPTGEGEPEGDAVEVVKTKKKTKKKRSRTTLS